MITVYTAILAEYDNLRVPAVISPNAKYVCFSDRPRSVSPWEMQSFPQILDTPAKNVRIPKCLPHLLLDTEFSIFHDGAFRMQYRAEKTVELLGDCDLAMFGHPGGHKSIHDERNFYKKLHGYIPDEIEAQYQKYVAENLPDAGGFWAGGFIIRRHTAAVAAFNECWFQEYLAGSSNDQFALYAAVAKTGIKVATIGGIATMDSRFGYCLHADSKCGDNPRYEAENAVWSSRVARIKELATPMPQSSLAKT